MMSIIWSIVIGFVVGLLARALKPGDDKMGFIVTTLVGVSRLRTLKRSAISQSCPILLLKSFEIIQAIHPVRTLLVRKPSVISPMQDRPSLTF